MFDVTKDIQIDGVPYVAHITKWHGQEWKLTVLDSTFDAVYNHSPEECINALILQLETKGFDVVEI